MTTSAALAHLVIPTAGRAYSAIARDLCAALRERNLCFESADVGIELYLMGSAGDLWPDAVEGARVSWMRGSNEGHYIRVEIANERGDWTEVLTCKVLTGLDDAKVVTETIANVLDLF